ncbi:MAG: ammonium transporter [Acidobacteriota bacterium]
MRPIHIALLCLMSILAVAPLSTAAAQEAAAEPAEEAPAPPADDTAEVIAALEAKVTELEGSLQNNINIVWTGIAAFLVLFMQPGFAMLEAGFTQAKNAVNIMMKNFMDLAIGTLAFFVLGFALMFGETSNGWFGSSLFALSGITGSDWTFTFWIFQVVFAATAATIVSGAVAGRFKFTAYLVATAAIAGVIYPIFGKWAWGSLLLDEGAGWLEGRGFIDFAGSTVVHSMGGWLALAAVLVLGPRIGKFSSDGKPQAMPGHSIPLAALGVFILFFGWFGFNAGSTTTGDGELGRVAVTTMLAAAGGALAAMITAWAMFGKPDASMTANGVIGGLVSITAPCYTVTPWGAVITGVIGGVLVVFSILFLERVLKVDDPVGAISAHGTCGAWGTLACGLFGAEAIVGAGDANTGLFYGGGAGQVGIQLIGIGAAFVWAFATGLILFFALKSTIGVRVSETEELEGLDIGEHGMEAYSGFQIFTTQ